MSEFTEVTAENLKRVRGAKGMNQDEVAEIIGLSGYHISNIEKGKRALSPAEKSLLDLYFFGVIPFEIVNEKLLHGVLDFTEDQWRVVTILATRNSMTPGKWIAERIRWMLAGDNEAREELTNIHNQRKQHNAQLTVVEQDLKVAEGN